MESEDTVEIATMATTSTHTNHTTRSSPNQADEEEIGKQLYFDIREVWVYLMLIVTVCGMATNIINVTAFNKMGLKETVSLSFFYLSLFDLSVVMSMFVAVASLIQDDFYIKETLRLDPFVIMYILSNIKDFFYALSASVTLYLSVIKTMCVFRPLTFKTMFNSSRTNQVMLAAFLVTSAFFMPAILTISVGERGMCCPNRTRLVVAFPSHRMIANEIKSVGEIVTTLATQAVNIACVVILTRTLRMSANFKKARSSGEVVTTTVNSPSSKSEDDQGGNSRSSSTNLSGKELQAVKQVTTVAIIYILCNTPKVVTGLSNLAVPGFGEAAGMKYRYIYRSLLWIRTLSEVLNCSVNIGVYLAFNKNFRKALPFSSSS